MFKRIIMLLVAVAVSVAPAISPARADEGGGPLTIVATVLSLSTEQVQTLGGIIQARSRALEPVMQQIQAHAQQAIAQTNAQFEATLTPDQAARLKQIRETAPVCEVIPAFKAVGLM